MQQRQRDAMDLPEIRASIGPHLTLASLHSCVLVSKDWRATFTPFLWKTFYFGPHKGDISLNPPSSATIQRYAHHIQTLVVRSLTAVTFQLSIFRDTPLTQLRELYMCEAVGEAKCTTGLGWLFLQNPGLKVVDYDGGHSKPGGGRSDNYYDDDDILSGQEQQEQEREEGDFEVLLSRCPELTDLTTRFVEYDRKHRELLWQLCESRLKRMSFYVNKFSYDVNLRDTIRMPHLQELSIHNIGSRDSGGSALPGLETILGCPNLRVLRWFAASADPTVATFQQILASCPRLEAIELQRMVLADGVIASVLETMQGPATEVIVPKRKEPFTSGGIWSNSLGFKTKAFSALERRHFATLVVLDMGTQSKEVTSPMILRVLSSCTNLKEITACQLLAKEIRDGPGVWACRGLEVFRVKIRGFRDPLIDLIRAAVFRRFATLPRLRILHIGGQDRKEESVVLRLDCGMGQLVGLERLEI
ncbi:hypothetical protein BG015_005172 [Linnemannia schmuckeri]|uniref:F-box domain-containing protein n=1 Tax=Linnemannia schmuckeri TaxID=64567 RepID=A0A9P5VFC5_9FUNG|nr:hypothetical protein BG015_005172 [Linnemannia schmuckeri]